MYVEVCWASEFRITSGHVNTFHNLRWGVLRRCERGSVLRV